MPWIMAMLFSRMLPSLLYAFSQNYAPGGAISAKCNEGMGCLYLVYGAKSRLTYPLLEQYIRRHKIMVWFFSPQINRRYLKNFVKPNNATYLWNLASLLRINSSCIRTKKVSSCFSALLTLFSLPQVFRGKLRQVWQLYLRVCNKRN